jgi:hypothetical protein
MLLGCRLIGMAPLFESGKMQVRSLPSQFCYYQSRLIMLLYPNWQRLQAQTLCVTGSNPVRSTKFFTKFILALVAELADAADLKSVLF